MDAAHDHPRLGEVLLGHGLLTEEKLHDALAEQQRTGERLGKLLVERGVPAHSIAMALADQVGGPVRTEYGIATGWSSSRGAQAPTAVVSMVPQQTARDEEIRALEARLAERERELEALERELEALRAERDDDDDHGPDRDDFLVVTVVDGRYVVHLGRGAAPQVGAKVRLPGAAEVVVTRERRRRCLYTAPAVAPAAAAVA